jgi:hypothetical protein
VQDLLSTRPYAIPGDSTLIAVVRCVYILPFFSLKCPDGFWKIGLMDTFSASPRAHLSEAQLEALRLFFNLETGKHLPSVRQLKYEREHVVKLAGSNTTERRSSHNNIFFANSLETIMKHVSNCCWSFLMYSLIFLQEFSNAETRRFIRTYPEDRSRRGQSRSETWHFSKWGEHAAANSACPMARAANGKDYYVYEPALAYVESDLRAVMPIRFFRRGSVLFARVCLLIRMVDEDGNQQWWIDGTSEPVAIALDDFELTVLEFEEEHKGRGMPSPHTTKSKQGHTCCLCETYIHAQLFLAISTSRLDLGIALQSIPGEPKRRDGVCSLSLSGFGATTRQATRARNGTSITRT